MYAVISFSHQNTSALEREKLHFNDDENLRFLSLLHTIDGISESIVLSTCNRCEIYLSLALKDSKTKKHIEANTHSYQEIESNETQMQAEKILQEVLECLAKFKHVKIENLRQIAQIFLQSHAIHHVFCVASSLLSVVVGETQISGQLKHSYKLSYDNNFCAKYLTRLIHFAFRCAAEVRNQTDISKNPISVASVAVNVACDYFQNYIDKKMKVLVIGVGEMGVLCVKNLVKHHLSITLCNRTRQNAENLINDLALQEAISLLDFVDLHKKINEYDIVFSAVAGGVVLTKEMLNITNNQRIFFDLSMPRNFAFDNAVLKEMGFQNLEVIGVDDLQEKAKQHMTSRQTSAKEAMRIVGKFVVEFEHWLSTLGVDPLIKTMRFQAKQASLKEINRAIKKGFIPEALRDNVTKLIHNAFNEFLHAPTMRIKSIAEDENADTMLESISNVFGKQNSILLNRYKCEYDNTTHE